jgi:hypothetical protein
MHSRHKACGNSVAANEAGWLLLVGKASARSVWLQPPAKMVVDGPFFNFHCSFFINMMMPEVSGGMQLRCMLDWMLLVCFAHTCSRQYFNECQESRKKIS